MADQTRGRRLQKRNPSPYAYEQSQELVEYGGYSDDYTRPSPRRKSRTREALDRVKAAIGLPPEHSPDRSHGRGRGRSYDLQKVPARTTMIRRESYSLSPVRGAGFGGGGGSSSSASTGGRKRGSSSRRFTSRERSRVHHMVEAAIDAAAVEAFRLRKEPGPWLRGPKASRVATAAVSAAAIDMLLERNSMGRHNTLRLAESTFGGVLASRLVNGPREELRGRR